MVQRKMKIIDLNLELTNEVDFEINAKSKAIYIEDFVLKDDVQEIMIEPKNIVNQANPNIDDKKIIIEDFFFEINNCNFQYDAVIKGIIMLN